MTGAGAEAIGGVTRHQQCSGCMWAATYLHGALEAVHGRPPLPAVCGGAQGRCKRGSPGAGARARLRLAGHLLGHLVRQPLLKLQPLQPRRQLRRRLAPARAQRHRRARRQRAALAAARRRPRRRRRRPRVRGAALRPSPPRPAPRRRADGRLRAGARRRVARPLRAPEPAGGAPGRARSPGAGVEQRVGNGVLGRGRALAAAPAGPRIRAPPVRRARVRP